MWKRDEMKVPSGIWMEAGAWAFIETLVFFDGAALRLIVGHGFLEVQLSQFDYKEIPCMCNNGSSKTSYQTRERERGYTCLKLKFFKTVESTGRATRVNSSLHFHISNKPINCWLFIYSVKSSIRATPFTSSYSFQISTLCHVKLSIRPVASTGVMGSTANVLYILQCSQGRRISLEVLPSFH